MLQNWLNTLGFGLRSKIKWSRGPYLEPDEAKTHLWEDHPNQAELEQRELELLSQYDLSAVYHHSGKLRYIETLTFLDILDQLRPRLTPNKSNPAQWLDIGIKNGGYLPALVAAGQCWFPEEVHVTGIELDAYRVYADFHSRWDYAQCFFKPYENATYLVGDVLEHEGQYDLITHFLPFVFPEPCQAWGLPKKHFRPKAIFEKSVDLLKPGGSLLIVNQGQSEYDAQGELCQSLSSQDFRVNPVGEMPPSFLKYAYPRFAWVITKTS